MADKQPEFQRIQQAFANHIKNPHKVAPPIDVDDRHMTIYRDLFFKNVMGFLSGTFPVLAEVVGNSRWQEIGRDFFVNHHNETPYFLEISREFLTFLETEFVPTQIDPVYIYELAHYEWLELFVDVEPEESVSHYHNDGDVLSSKLVLSPVVEGFLYQFPVHEISADKPSCEARSTALIVYRGRDDRVGFAETNPFTLKMLALLKSTKGLGQDVLKSLLDDNGMAGNHAAFQGGVDTLKHWLQLGIIWGFEA